MVGRTAYGTAAFSERHADPVRTNHSYNCAPDLPFENTLRTARGNRSAGPLLILLLFVWAGSAPLARAQSINLQTAPGGFAITGTHPGFDAGFGNVNGLGVGMRAAGVSVMTNGVTGGVLYTTNYSIVVSGTGAQSTAVILAFLLTNFSHSSTLQLQTCYPAASCTSPAAFTPISTSLSSPTTIVAKPGVLNGTYTASLGLFVSNANGGSAFAGTDTATIAFLVYAYSSNSNALTFKELDTFEMDSPNETVQTAVQLQLSTSASGLTIVPANDFSVNYGTVNGLGISPSGGLSVVSASGGVIYSTPYVITPSFSGFSSTTGTVNAYVSSNFAHSAILKLEDASSASGPYTAISTSSVAPTVFTTTASSNSTMNRYLGLFASNANGGSAFSGSDTATLTYTLTVP